MVKRGKPKFAVKIRVSPFVGAESPMSSTLVFVGLQEDSKSSITKTLWKSNKSDNSIKCLTAANTQVDLAVNNGCRQQSADQLAWAYTASPNPWQRGDADELRQGDAAAMEITLQVPNAPKSCIGEIFSSETADKSPVKNGSSRPRVMRDTPTRPRDTHSRLFGQIPAHQVAPMVTDTIRSHIQFGDAQANGISPSHSPSKSLPNGSASSTPSRASYMPPKRNPVTGDGVSVPPPRRRHPAAGLRGADHDAPPEPRSLSPPAISDPRPAHRYFTRDWPPQPANYYVESTSKPTPNVRHTPYTLLGLKTDDPEKEHPVIDPDSLSPQLVLDRHWPPFPAQHYLERTEKKFPYHPLPPYAFIGMTSALGDRPQPDYKYDPVPALDGPIDPYLVANTVPPPTLFKYERDGPIPDVSLLQTPLHPGPHTLAGFPPIFHKYVPGYLFSLDRHAEDFNPKTYYVDYVRRREMEGNPITGDGYKSMNGQINTVTSVNGASFVSHSRVPPGGYSSGLW